MVDCGSVLALKYEGGVMVASDTLGEDCLLALASEVVLAVRRAGVALNHDWERELSPGPVPRRQNVH